MKQDSMEILVVDNDVGKALRKLNQHIQNSRRASLMKRRAMHPSRRGRLKAKRVETDKRIKRKEWEAKNRK